MKKETQSESVDPFLLLMACGLSLQDGEVFDIILRENTDFSSFVALFNTAPTVSPILDTKKHEVLHLIADVYDSYQEEHGDTRQIVRTETFNDWLERNA